MNTRSYSATAQFMSENAFRDPVSIFGGKEWKTFQFFFLELYKALEEWSDIRRRVDEKLKEFISY